MAACLIFDPDSGSTATDPAAPAVPEAVPHNAAHTRTGFVTRQHGPTLMPASRLNAEPAIIRALLSCPHEAGGRIENHVKKGLQAGTVAEQP